MIRVGIAGWSYSDWEGIVYPARKPARFDHLAYIAGYFDAIEINTTFYRIPEPSRVASWVRRVAGKAEFRFTVKLFQGFTHRDPEGAAAEESAFKRALEPLVAANLLGAILVQFPYSFRPGRGSWEKLEGLLEIFGAYPLVVEVRHREWATKEFFDFLRTRKVGFCNIDQPQISRSLDPTEIHTSEKGYVRLHGRNAKDWFRPEAGPARRYDYLYSEQELAPWVERIRRMEEQTVETFVIANNHYRGKAPLAALTLLSMILGRPVAAPADLVQTYPSLAARARPGTPVQRNLFQD